MQQQHLHHGSSSSTNSHCSFTRQRDTGQPCVICLPYIAETNHRRGDECCCCMNAPGLPACMHPVLLVKPQLGSLSCSSNRAPCMTMLGCAVPCCACCAVLLRGDPEDWLHHIRDGHQQQQQQQQGRRHYLPGQRYSGSSSSSSSTWRQGEQRSSSTAAGRGGSSGGSNGGSNGAAQPRPYFWRMQQHMMAR